MKVLVFLEDPGAANMAVGLSEALARRGVETSLLVEPALRPYLEARGIAASVRDPGTVPDAHLAGIDALAVGTSENVRTFAHDLVAAARRLGIPSAGLVDSPVYADRRFRGTSNEPLFHCPDTLLLPDARSVASYAALGCAPDRLHLCGHPLYDYVRRRRDELARSDRGALRERLFPGLGNRPLYLFLAAPIDAFDRESSYRNASYTLAGRGRSTFRSMIALEEVLDAAKLDARRPAVALRLHPKNDPADFDSCGDELAGIMQGGDVHESVWAADAVLGMPTMLLLEAMLMDRAALGVLPTPQEVANLPAIEDGVIPAVWTREDLRAALPKLDGRTDRREILEAFCPPDAAERIADAIRSMIRPRPTDSGRRQASP
jgi:hypothetical protein